MGLNQAYLQTLFSTHFGCGVMAYANRLRIEKACFLLKNSELSITDIACETGYNSRQQFGYSFHRQMGKSPQQYRKELGYQFQEGFISSITQWETKVFKDCSMERAAAEICFAAAPFLF